MSELNRQTMKPRAEHMTKGELVAEFRKLQKWYNIMKEAVTKLEEEHAELQEAHQESVNLNLVMTERARNLQTIMTKQITDDNADKQELYSEIAKYQVTIRELREGI